MTQPLPADPIFAAIEAHRDAHLARAAVRYLPIHRETKKAPDVPGLQVVSNKGEWPRGNEPLDAPILSQGTNQARRGSRPGLPRPMISPQT